MFISVMTIGTGPIHAATIIYPITGEHETMTTLTANRAKQWLKKSNNPAVIKFVSLLKSIIHFNVPAPRTVFLPLYIIYRIHCSFLSNIFRVFVWTPLFKGRLRSVGRSLYLYGGLPYVSGPVQMYVGSNCRISGCTTFSGRTNTKKLPILMVGDNVDIGWMTTIAVGQRVELGNNVRIAGQVFLAGYPGHPIDPIARAAGLPETDEQVGDIILDDDVWLSTGVSIMSGVRIGRGSIVAAGSVVTKDIPSMVLAGGNPARVIRSFPPGPIKQ